eukprot:CAMPEP_0177733340 /NCGR_PEP_ID=MMETSP0484_2-20121128/23628_1 /TAXON_ID=354590 /ORGANISM="Rhodomonas lens, Strain RHODO" /LENGTH=131 /DNA_ID=CAMNT_0019246705 /DNA_START=143 /DNA_END=534 /DNA_ORIENTATION=-
MLFSATSPSSFYVQKDTIRDQRRPFGNQHSPNRAASDAAVAGSTSHPHAKIPQTQPRSLRNNGVPSDSLEWEGTLPESSFPPKDSMQSLSSRNETTWLDAEANLWRSQVLQALKQAKRNATMETDAAGAGR